MTLRLLVRKLLLKEERFVPASELKKYCSSLGLTYPLAIGYLLKYGYVKRILRGFFYVPTIEERKLKAAGATYLEAISMAMKHRNIKNWYFGLETAMKLNNLTHEYFSIDYVISDTLFRPEPLLIFGHRVKFVKLKPSLFGFGTKRKGHLIYSDVEKTLLDMVYLGKYAGKDDNRLRDEVDNLIDHTSKRRLARYASHYNGSVKSFEEAYNAS